MPGQYAVEVRVSEVRSDGFGDEVAEVRRMCEVARVTQLIAPEPGPRADEFTRLAFRCHAHRAAERERAVRPAVVGAAGSILMNRSTELRDREQQDVVRVVSKIVDERANRSGERSGQVRELPPDAALVLMRESTAAAKGLKPMARIVGHATQSQHPSEFTIAPIGALKNLFDKTGWTVDDVDLFEVNEAFAMVAMMPILDLGLDPETVNIFGGACAQGHPVGSTGSRIIVTLMNA